MGAQQGLEICPKSHSYLTERANPTAMLPDPLCSIFPRTVMVSDRAEAVCPTASCESIGIVSRASAFWLYALSLQQPLTELLLDGRLYGVCPGEATPNQLKRECKRSCVICCVKRTDRWKIDMNMQITASCFPLEMSETLPWTTLSFLHCGEQPLTAASRTSSLHPVVFTCTF